MRLFHDMKSIMFILKCVSITNLSLEHYIWKVLLDNNKKQNKQKTKKTDKETCFERLHQVVFQFFIQKYYI